MDSWWITDGGMETDLIFHRGATLEEFAAFPLLEDAAGREMLRSYYDSFAALAARSGRGLVLESPTWRANPDWGAVLGYDVAGIVDVNRRAMELLQQLADAYRPRVPQIRLHGVIGPRGDGYVATSATGAGEAERYHEHQVSALAAAGAEAVQAYTLTTVAEAVGVVRAARAAGVAVGVAFTVETDGTIPDGTGLGEAVRRVDEAAAPDWFGLNCAHPSHMTAALGGPGGDDWLQRVAVLRPNASRLSHAELDALDHLDDGDVAELALQTAELAARLPALRVVGGCCGTDARHVAAMHGVDEVSRD